MNIEDVKEYLISTKNTIDLTILAIDNGKINLIATGVEDAYSKMQDILDYCVEG